MPSIDRIITVQKLANEVWEFMADFCTTEHWDPPTVRTIRASGDGGVGTVYRNTSKVLGREIDVTYTVIEFDPPRMLRLRGETSSMTAVDTIEVDDTYAGTRVHYAVDFSLNGVANLFEPLLPVGLKNLGDSAEKQLRQSLEAL